MNRHTGSILLMAAALTAGSAVAAPAEAPDTLEIQSMTVRYDAAQVRDQRSARQLFFRIREAAEEVCRISPYARGHEIWHEHDCEAAALKQAVRDADIPALEQYYVELSERPLSWRR